MLQKTIANLSFEKKKWSENESFKRPSYNVYNVSDGNLTFPTLSILNYKYFYSKLNLGSNEKEKC